MTDLETLAKRLTAAQREAIIGARKTFTYSLSGAPATLHSLKRKGITCGTFADRFTDPLGLRLRTYLMENPQ